MPLTMTIDGSDKVPRVTPCFEGKELNLDSELVSTGLSAISVKGCDAGDRRGETGIRHRNSFWSVHRPELSKLSWAASHAPPNIETYLKIHAGDKHSQEEFKGLIIPPATFDKLTVIHQTSEDQTDIVKLDKLISKPETIQFSDHDLESHTTLHKSRAEFCVTIGNLEEHCIPQNTSEPSSSTAGTKCSQNFSFDEDYSVSDIRSEKSDVKINCVLAPSRTITVRTVKNQEIVASSESYNKLSRNLSKQYEDEKLSGNPHEMLIAVMDDSVQH